MWVARVLRLAWTLGTVLLSSDREGILDYHSIEILAGLEVFAQDTVTAGGTGSFDDQCIPDCDVISEAGLDCLLHQLWIG